MDSATRDRGLGGPDALSAPGGALPNVIVIGAGRAGTTSLHHYLDEHPRIAMSRPKELRFFADLPDADVPPPLRDTVDRRLATRAAGGWRRGLDWYRAHFDPRMAVRGESTPAYLSPWFPGCAERMARVVPDAKLICCVRDPVEQAVSHYRLARALGKESRSIDEALVPHGYYEGRSRCGMMLGRYRRFFDPDQILVIDGADLGARRRTTLQTVFAFLGVDEEFWSPRLERRWNEETRQRGLRWRVYARSRKLPAWSRITVLPPRRSHWWLERLAGRVPRGETAVGPSSEVRDRLARGLADDTAQLRELTGLPLSDWSTSGTAPEPMSRATRPPTGRAD